MVQTGDVVIGIQGGGTRGMNVALPQGHVCKLQKVLLLHCKQTSLHFREQQSVLVCDARGVRIYPWDC